MSTLLATASIRPAKPEDFGNIIKLNRHHFHGTTCKLGFWGRLRFILKSFLSRIGYSRIKWIVAESQNEFLGFAAYEIWCKRMHILRIAIEPTKLRQGVGTKLVLELESISRSNKAKVIFLEVRSTKKYVQLFYESLKFKVTNVLRGFYSDTKENGLRMERVL